MIKPNNDIARVKRRILDFKEQRVDVTVRRLREKIEDDPANPTLILTRRGVGYYFSAES